jgi:2-polyprenyl-6-methoxyphenol hydroxylase-like FAD-dependent oxidoreductase
MINKNVINKFLIKSVIKNFSKISTDVCIIGGGSIGMTLSKLLTKYNVNHMIVEKEQKREKLFDHPKAHYISPKTVETFKYLDIFNDHYFDNKFIDNIENWRYYRYCEYLLKDKSYYGNIDHFKNDIKRIIDYVRNISNAYPMHIGQNKLNEIIFNSGNLQNQYLFGYELDDFKYISNENNYQINIKNNISKEEYSIKSKIIVGCDGSHSKVRRLLNISTKGENNIQSFVNTHFKSKLLADKLKQIGKQSMLHFIFNPKYVCVLISYDLDEGEFVLQIPYFPEVEKEENYTNQVCEYIVRQMLTDDLITKESIDIVNLYF